MDSMTTERLQSLLSQNGSVRALLEHRVDASPDKAFIMWRGTNYTYAQIDGISNSVANSLLRLGVGSRDRVGIMMRNSVEWVAPWLAVAKIGAIAVTLNTAYKGAGLAYLLNHSNLSLFFLDAEFEQRLLDLADETAIGSYFVHGDGGSRAARPMAQLLGGRQSRPSARDITLSTPCSILYTSGTTGPPKGCVLTNGQYIASAYLQAAHCAYGSSIPPDMGEEEILVAVVAEDGLDPAALVAFCRERTAAHQVPRYGRVVPELPRTQTERVEKYRLREIGLREGAWDSVAGAFIKAGAPDAQTGRRGPGPAEPAV